MARPTPSIPRFVVLYWTNHSSQPITEPVSGEGSLALRLKELREDGEVTEFATYSFTNALQREPSFRQIFPT